VHDLWGFQELLINCGHSGEQGNTRETFSAT
jgi:hypothetical protein